METQTGLWLIAWLLIVGGFLGTFVPFLPGVSFIFCGMAIAAWADDFQRIGYGMLLLLLVLTMLAHIIDYAASAIGAKKMGASKYAIWGSLIGSVVGVFSGLVGILFFPFVGAVIGELIARWDVGQATKVGIGTWLGLVLGIACKIAIAFTMLGLFILAYYMSGTGIG